MKAILKLLKYVFFLIVILVLLYFFWPANLAEFDYTYPTLPSDPEKLENYIAEQEAKIPNIKPDNQAQIIWADSTKQVTEYALVYLHGFSASQGEGAPTHKKLAKYFGMNLYLARLSHHGIEGVESMTDYTAEQGMASALEAVAIGKNIGRQVILVGTSTGATVGLPIMANDPDLHAGIFYSPNIRLFDERAKLLSRPFGLSVAKAVSGGDYHEFSNKPPNVDKYWTTKYRLEATIELLRLMESTMTEEVFEKVTQPMLFLSYYKNEEEQDHVVSVKAIKECFEQLGTKESLKKYVEIPTVGNHAMASDIYSSDTETPFKESVSFIEEQLGIWPKG